MLLNFLVEYDTPFNINQNLNCIVKFFIILILIKKFHIFLKVIFKKVLKIYLNNSG